MKRLSKIKTLNPKLGLLLVFIFSLLTFWACPNPPPEPEPIYTTTFEVYQIGAVDARLHIAVGDYYEGWHSKIFLDGNLVADSLKLL